MHEVHVGGSFYAGPPLEAHFGLGNVTNIDEVRIDFPDGRTVQRFNVGVDQALTLGGLTEVSTLTLIKVGPTGSQLNWDPVEFADGYDILRGDLGALASGDFGACLSDNVLLTQFTDLDSPGPLEAYSYLVRAVTLPGTLGPLGFNPDDTPRTNSNPADCP